MANTLSLTLTDLAFNPLVSQPGPILTSLGGSVMLTEIDQFSAHRIVLTASDELAIKAIDPANLPCGCIITDNAVGDEVARGYILNPQAQIDNTNGHQITLAIPNVTTGLTWDVTGPGWVAATGMDTIANRLASHSPPWVAHVVDTGPPVLTVQPLHWTGADPHTSYTTLNQITKGNPNQSGTVAKLAPGWDVGAISQESILSGDGAVSSVAFGSSTNRMFGLATNLPNYSYEHIHHAMYFSTDGTNNPNNGVLMILEDGVQVVNLGNKYYQGDLGTVAVVNGVVKYLVNNVVVYTSTRPPQYPIYASCSLHDDGAAILGASISSYVAPKDAYYAVGFENATILDAELQLGQRTYRHVRQKQINGVNQMELELGLFGAAPTMVLKTADAESPRQVRLRNSYTRMIEQTNYAWDAQKIITIGAAFGGGTGDTQVNLRNLWQIVNDPTYPGYGMYGNVPGSIWPEYDAVNYPIERRVSLNGNFYYVIKDTQGIAKMRAKGHWSGELWGAIDDSSITYVDQSPDAQKEAVQRTLYVSGVTKLRKASTIHFTDTIITDGRGKVTQAGDLVHIILSRTGRDRQGLTINSFKEVDLALDATVMSVQRDYSDTEVKDTWKVSTLARLLDSDASALTDTMRAADILRITPTTGETTFVLGPIEQTINSRFPLTIPMRLPNTMFRMTSATFHVELKPARHNVKFQTIEDGQHNHPVPIPPLTVNAFDLVAHDHVSYVPSHNHGKTADTYGVSGNTDISHQQGTSAFAYKGGGAYKQGNVTDGIGVSDGIGVADTITVTGTGSVTNAGIATLDAHTHTLFIQGGGTPDGGSGNTSLGGYLYLQPVDGQIRATNQRQTLAKTNNADRQSTSHGHASNFSANRGGAASKTGAATKTGNVTDGISVLDTIGVGGGGIVIDFVGTATLGSGLASVGWQSGNYSGSGATDANLSMNGSGPGTFVGITSATNTTTATNSGLHTHALAPDIVETSLGGEIQVWINSGDGVFVDRSGELGGPWTGTMDVLGDLHMEKFLQAPGKMCGFQIVAVNTPGNPTGLCNVQVSGTFELEKTATNSTIYAA